MSGLGLWRQVPNAAPPAPPLPSGTLFQGKALGGFSDGVNTVLSAANHYVDWRPGKTLWLVYQASGAGATVQTVISSYDGALFQGWSVDRATSPNGQLSLTSDTSALPLVTPKNGISTICLVWRASDNAMLVSINGSPLASVGTIVAPTAALVTWVSGIGTPTGQLASLRHALDNDRILAAAMWSTEASAAQAAAFTYTQGNRLHLPAVVLSDASTVYDFQADRDFTNGGASITTHGSTPVTYTVSGAPLLVACDETRFAMADAYASDGKLSSPMVDANGILFTLRDSYSRVRITTDGPVVSVEAYSTEQAIQAAHATVALLVNGSWVEEDMVGANGFPQTFNTQPGAGAAKACDLVEGPQSISAGPIRFGTCFLAFRIPVYFGNGSTLTNGTMVAATSPASPIVFAGDSILTGFFVSVFSRDSVTALARSHYAGGVVCHSAGSDSIAIEAGTGPLVTATAAALAAELGTSGSLWIAWGTNDYFAGVPVATWSTNYAALIDAVHALKPGARIFCQSAIQRIAPASEGANGAGETLGQQRAALATLCASRPWAHYVEGAAGALLPNGDIGADGIHPNSNVNYEASIRAILGY